MASAASPTRSLAGVRPGGIPFLALIALLGAAFLFGGSARGDVLSLLVLRPLAVIGIAIALFGLTRAEIVRFRGPLIMAALILLVVASHLVPLPPAIWAALPGREPAVEAARLGGSLDAWRPLALVPWRAWNSLFALLVPVAALLLAIRCTDAQRRQLPVVILLLVLACLVWGGLQVASGYEAVTRLYRISNENMPTGLFANRNHFAVLIACAFPLMAIVALRSGAIAGARAKAGTRRSVAALGMCGAIAIAGLVLLLLTGSRAGLFAMAIALVSIPIVYRPPPSRTRLRDRRVLALGIFILVMVLLAALSIYFARAESVDRLLETHGDEELRLGVWQATLEITRHYFPLGSGIGSFVEVFQAHEPRELLRFTYANHTHNDWLEYALELGIPGILLMIAAVAAWLFGAARLLRASPVDDGDVLLGRAGAIIILLLGLASVVDYPARTPSIACLLAIAAVWMVSGLRKADR